MLTALQQLRAIHESFDLAASLLAESLSTPLCIRCGTCCQGNVPQCSTLEGIDIVSANIAGGRLKKLVSIAEGWLLERHSWATIYEGMPTGWSNRKLAEEWRSASRSQCPFMQNRGCLIHDARPLVCRSFGVTRDGAEVCRRPLGKGEDVQHRAYVDASGIKLQVDTLTQYSKKHHPEWLKMGMMPTMLYRCAEPVKFRAMCSDNRVASVKLIGIDLDANLMWQPDIEELRCGVSPDLVLARR